MLKYKLNGLEIDMANQMVTGLKLFFYKRK